MKNKKGLFIIIIILLIIFVSSILVLNKETKSSNDINGNNKISNSKPKKKIYKHIYPDRVKKSDYFKGEFISNCKV